MVNALEDFLAKFIESLTTVGNDIVTRFAQVVPDLILAIILVLIGLLIARIVKQVVIKILQSTKVDQWIDEQNLTAAIGGKEISAIVGSLTKWYVIGLFLAQAAGLLKLATFERYLTTLFIETQGGGTPVFFALLGAVVVMLVGLLIARYARNIIEATTFKLKRVAGILAEAIIIVFAGIISLNLVFGEGVAMQVLGLLTTFIEPFLQAFAWVIAIVVGVTLLLDRTDDIKKVLRDVKKAFK
jgi:hypothetical protein